ncbi:MAG: hypothetical protein F4089_07240 [Gammaproteobacteria bacterium]|nr:hypothetical protein [Acidobacteriota bacterium]MYA15271.1 hypothetical protein [Gammaproteobacteria bacterium]MYJ74897.1 hypothetical protein [Gammaproteobacteria bacterium]
MALPESVREAHDIRAELNGIHLTMNAVKERMDSLEQTTSKRMSAVEDRLDVIEGLLHLLSANMEKVLKVLAVEDPE